MFIFVGLAYSFVVVSTSSSLTDPILQLYFFISKERILAIFVFWVLLASLQYVLFGSLFYFSLKCSCLDVGGLFVF